MNDPFERAKKIRTGELDAEMPSYDELAGWLQRVPMTWLPGLLRQCVASCVHDDVFQPDALKLFVEVAEREAKDPASILRKQ